MARVSRWTIRLFVAPFRLQWDGRTFLLFWTSMSDENAVPSSSDCCVSCMLAMHRHFNIILLKQRHCRNEQTAYEWDFVCFKQTASIAVHNTSAKEREMERQIKKRTALIQKHLHLHVKWTTDSFTDRLLRLQPAALSLHSLLLVFSFNFEFAVYNIYLFLFAKHFLCVGSLFSFW